MPPDFPVGQFIGYLDEVWANRLLFAVEDFGEEPVEFEPSRKLPFFDSTYLREIKARNYIGFVNWEDHLITDSSREPDQFTGSSEMIPGRNIRIFAADVPMVFDDLKGADKELGERLEGILKGIVSEAKT